MTKKPSISHHYTYVPRGDLDMCAEAKPQAMATLRMMQNGVPVRKSRKVFPANGADVLVSVNPNMVWINAEARSGFLFTEKVPAHSSAPHDFIATNKTGFAGINLKKTPPLLASKIGQWLGDKPECVTWQGRSVYIDGKAYTVLPVTYGEVVDYAFIKNGYLVILYDGGLGSVGYKLFKKSTLDTTLSVNVPVFEDGSGIASAGMFITSDMQIRINRAATKLVFMGVDGSTPASGFPPECTETPTGISSSGKWKSVIRFNIGDITGANELTGAWLTIGVREDFFSRPIFKTTQTNAVTNNLVNSYSSTLSPDTPPDPYYTYSQTRTITVNDTNTETVTSSSIVGEIYNPPIKQYVYFDSDDAEQFALETAQYSGVSSNSTVTTTSRSANFVETFVGNYWDGIYFIEGRWRNTSLTQTDTASVYVNNSSSAINKRKASFRGHEFSFTVLSLDTVTQYNSLTTQALSGSIPDVFDFASLFTLTITSDFSGESHTLPKTSYSLTDAGVFINGGIIPVRDIFFGVNQYIDDCTQIKRRIVIDDIDAVRVKTTSTLVDSIRGIFSIETPVVSVVTSSIPFGSPATHGVEVRETPADGSEMSVTPLPLSIVTPDTSSESSYFFYPASYVGGDPINTIHDESSLIQPLSDRYNNMLYTLKNTMVSPNQTGAKALKTGFIPESTEKQSAIAAEVSVPNDVTGVI